MNGYEKFKVITTGISVVFIPIVLAFVGNWYTSSIKEKEIQGDFVKLAVGILREEPSTESKNLRTWAAKVIDEYSGVPLNQDAFDELVNQMKLVVTRNLGVMAPSFQEAASKATKISANRLALLTELKLEGKLSDSELSEFS